MTVDNRMTTPYWLLLTTVFITGGCVLVIELIGTRLLAPFFGSGIYTWSALIAVTLGSLAIGYAFGGLLADRKPAPKMMYLLCAAAGIWTILTPWLARIILPILALIDSIRLSILIASCLLFLPNLFFLGAVAPYAIRLSTKDVSSVGLYSGMIYSVSTIGSLLGALMTGFVLIPNVSVHLIFTMCGILLLILALAGFVIIKNYRLATIALVLIIPSSLITTDYKSTDKIEVIDTKPSYYGQIHIIRIKTLKLLVVNGVVQNYVDEAGDYTTPYIDFLSSVPVLLGRKETPDKRGLLIGLGAGELVSRLKRLDYEVDVVDIDPKVAEIARKHFGIDIPSSRLHVMDGRVFFARNEELFDYVVIDAYAGVEVPGHLFTEEALSDVSKRLRKDGVLAINMASLSGNVDLASLQRTLRRVFPNVRGFAYKTDNSLISNIFLASDQSLDMPVDLSLLDSSSVKVANNFLQNEIGDLAADVVYTDDFNPINHHRRHVQLVWQQEMLSIYKNDRLDWLLQ